MERQAVVYVVSSPDFLRRWFGSHTPAGPGEDATFDGEVAPVPSAGGPGAPAWAGSRMVLAPGVLGYAANDLRALVRHELTHLATLGPGRSDPPPAWLVEGIAEYTAYRVVDGSGDVEGVTALALRGLPTGMWSVLRRSSYRPQLQTVLADFYAGAEDDVARRYSDGWFAVLYVADRKGEPALRRLWAAASGAPGGDPAAREAAALRSVLGTDRAGFAAAVSRYARDLRGNFV